MALDGGVILVQFTMVHQIDKHNKSVEPINYPAGNSSAHFKRYVKEKYE